MLWLKLDSGVIRGGGEGDLLQTISHVIGLLPGQETFTNTSGGARSLGGITDTR